jgi:hypothetical protein
LDFAQKSNFATEPSEALVPHDAAIGEMARTAAINDMDETSWLMHGDRHWRWVMANPLVAYFQMHPTRSKAAFAQLIDGWMGILVRDSYSVYTVLARIVAELLGPSAPHRQRAGGECGRGYCTLWRGGAH